jgi:hypothetical protein
MINAITILFYVAAVFGVGVLTGITIENTHRRQLRAKYRAMHGPTIEEAMFRDGWRI